MAEPTTTTAAPETANDPGGTEATEAPSTGTETKSTGLTLDDLLPVNDNAKAETGETEETAANDNAEPKVDAQKEVTAEALFTSEALATPEGIGRAREILLKAKDHLDHRHHRLDRFDTRLKRQAKELRAEQEAIKPVRGQAKLFIDEVKSLRAESGLSAKDRFLKMARLVGEDPQEFYESVSLGIATDGQQAPPPKEIIKLQEQLQRLEQQRQQEREQWEQSQRDAQANNLQGQIAQRMGEIAQACTDVRYPTLSAKIADGTTSADDAAQWVAELMTDHYESTGNRLDRSSAIASLETRLARAVGGSASRAPQGESRTAPRNGAGSPASSAGKRSGVTVTPSLADRSTGTGSKRKQTKEERLAELARDPEALAAIGLARYL